MPDGTRARELEVESTPHQVRIHENGVLISLLHARKQRCVLPRHRQVARSAQPQALWCAGRLPA